MHAAVSLFTPTTDTLLPCCAINVSARYPVCSRPLPLSLALDSSCRRGAAATTTPARSHYLSCPARALSSPRLSRSLRRALPLSPLFAAHRVARPPRVLSSAPPRSRLHSVSLWLDPLAPPGASRMCVCVCVSMLRVPALVSTVQTTLM